MFNISENQLGGKIKRNKAHNINKKEDENAKKWVIMNKQAQ